MKQQMKLFIQMSLFVGMSTVLVGCGSYFKKKECEKANWFVYGESISRGGGTIEGDKFVNECRKVEADIDEAKLDLGYKKGREEYCKPETAFMLGKRGDLFKDFMCEGGNLKFLKKRYVDGTLEYCAEKNGYPEGASGRVYQGVCPKNLEEKFLAKFNKGRQKYLEGLIASNEARIVDLEQEITRLNEDKRDTMLKLAMTPQKQQVVREVRVDERTGREVEKIRTEDDPASTSARNSIQSEMNSIDSQIRFKRSEQTRIKDEIQKHRSEIHSLHVE